uniref:TraB domain-containing protein n=1 Tax=Ascaris suum TaxID=6253 RepID=F1KY78_ASCSU
MSSESGQHVGDDGREIVLEHPVEEDLPHKSPSREGFTLKSALKQDTRDECDLLVEQSHHADGEHHVRLDLEGSDLTEEDIFRMKSLSNSGRGGTLSEMAEQSVVSVADSSSNFDERVKAEDMEGSDEDGTQEDISLLNGDDPRNVSAEKHPEDIRHDDVVQNRVYGGFVFDRDRPNNPNLPKETVTILNYPFEPTAIPAGDDEEEYRAALKAATVYLIGTAHFSPDSQKDVLTTIENTQPDMVMVELCPSRISILSMDENTLLHEAKNLNLEKIISTIKQSGAVQGILHVLLLSMSAHITRELGMAPGGEFRAAHRGAMNVKLCKLILGDRPIHVTLQRALGSLSFYQKLRLFYHILLSHKSSITQEEVERCKKSDMLEELLKEMAGEFPLLSKIFVEERDLYMTNTLHTLLRKSTYDKRVAWSKTDAAWQPVSVVAVVGIGHVPGIVANWNKSIDVVNLLCIPQPSRSTRIIRFALKGLIYGAAAYAAYRIGTKVATRIRTSFF